ncbi:GrpB family protein [Sporosarcina siberiensis]|uniref:GrpB family protein n=1 Tax=Sporosarcina siberiensis TaxID=1365606 RepID=A0ABW4SM46_9BACL
MLGLPKGEVFLVTWTEDWPKEFLLEKDRIQSEIGQYVVGIHHIGSTAVKGLKAKPIIDIAVEIKDFNDGKHCIAPLESLGYSYRGINILPDRHYFNKAEPRTHQIHMYQKGNKFLVEQLKFRNYLRSNDNAKMEYEELKIKLSKVNKHNKHKYADEKTDFISSVLAKL